MELTPDMKKYIDENLDHLILLETEHHCNKISDIRNIYQYFYIKAFHLCLYYKKETERLKFIIKELNQEIDELQEEIIEMRYNNVFKKRFKF